MYTKISLNGEWVLTGKTAEGKDISIPCTIPGYAHTALEKAGIIPEMFWRKNTEQCQWIEDVEWTFTKFFDVDKTFDLSHTELRFGGIDTFSDVYLNGQKILTSDNMFISYSANVSECLNFGTNELKVVVHPYKSVAPPADPPNHRAAFCNERAMIRRLQCTFFWDWVDRYVTAGIWQDVELAFLPQAVIDNVFTEVRDICETSASINFQIKTDNAVASNCRFWISITAPDGANVWDLSGRVFMDTMYLQADIINPKLWWPNGYGEQPLYTVCVALFDQNGTKLDQKTHKMGIRTVRFECLRDEPGSDSELRTNELRKTFGKTDTPISDAVSAIDNPTQYKLKGESFIVLVNGKRIFLKGGNWVPCTPFPISGMGEHYRKLLEAAAKSNQNTLRVWGGGIYELDEFYDACDELGIMVMQDFMLSCGKYPDDLDWWVESFNKELRCNILRLRNRASLIAWLGNNENGDGFDWDDPNMKNMPLQYKSYRPILGELDPNRPFRPCCSWGGEKNTDPTIGDAHQTWWFRGAEKVGPTWFDKVCRMATESAVEGYPLPTSLRKFLAEEDILNDKSEVTDYHIKNNMYFEPAGLLSVHDRLRKNTEILLGRSCERFRDIYNLAYLQYEWIRYSLEGARRSDWYCSGMLYWMYNDCWPALGYALIDYYGVPKAGWYAMKYSGAPIAATIRQKQDDIKFIALNNGFKKGEFEYRIKLYQASVDKINDVANGKFTLNPNENTEIISLPLTTFLPDGDKNVMVFLEIYCDGKMISRGRWYPDWLKTLSLPKTQLDISIDRKAKTITVKNLGKVAIGVAFDGDMVCEDNYIDLLQDEVRVINYTPLDGFDNIDVYGYNIDIVNKL